MLLNRKRALYSKKKRFKKKYSKKQIEIKCNKPTTKILLLIFVLLEIRFNHPVYKLFIKALNTKKTKVCLCAIAKWENLYLKFYIEHYRHLGYDHIYLYDNNNIDDEKVEDLIKKYINNGFVTLIDYRGYRGKKNNPQMEAYYDCYDKHYQEYDWLSFFDLDEYLILKPKGIKIDNFLESERYKDCPIVKINWLLYSDNDQIEYENKPFTKRFTKLSKHKSTGSTIKSIMRGNISYQNFSKSYSPHYLYKKTKSCSSSGKPSQSTYYINPPDYNFAILNHYTRTISEYVKKIKRGRAVVKSVLSKRRLKHFFNSFFAGNNKTHEKVKIFNDAFNTSFE